MRTIIERGDILFVYRPKVGTDTVADLDDVQRFEMVLIPDDGRQGRLLVVGRKQLPGMGQQDHSRRNWLMTTSCAGFKQLGEELHPLRYQTKTRGERQQGEAIPVGEGRYAIAAKDGDARFAYRLEQPTSPGPAQRAFNLHEEASYVIQARNPAVDVPGFPDKDPGYPKQLRDRFAEERWLAVDDIRLMHAESAQLLLVGAHTDLDDEPLEVTGTADAFAKLQQDRGQWPEEAVESGEFADPQYEASSKSPAGDRSRGGRSGGQAARDTASAAGISQALRDISFPQDRAGLVRHAKQHQANKEVVDTLEHFPSRNFETMADVQKALGEVR